MNPQQNPDLIPRSQTSAQRIVLKTGREDSFRKHFKYLGDTDQLINEIKNRNATVKTTTYQEPRIKKTSLKALEGFLDSKRRVLPNIED